MFVCSESSIPLSFGLDFCFFFAFPFTNIYFSNLPKISRCVQVPDPKGGKTTNVW